MDIASSDDSADEYDNEPEYGDEYNGSDEEDNDSGESEDEIGAESSDDEGDDGNEEMTFGRGTKSMEELLKLRDKIGTKNFDKNIVKKQGKSKTNVKKRENKNRPQEISSKQPRTSRKLNPRSNKTRDPRFDDLCGSKFDSKAFDKRYLFVHDMQDSELARLKRQLKKSNGKNIKIKEAISRLESRQKTRQRKMDDEEVMNEWKKSENEKVAKGKKPFYLKKSEVKKMLNEKRKEKLKEKGMLEKVSRKHEKKMTSKTKRMIPERRFK